MGIKTKLGLAGIIVAASSFIVTNEGTKSKAYQDSVGIWTICTGSTENVKPGQIATLGECNARLKKDIEQNCKDLDKISAPKNVLIAHCDLAFNIGRTKYRRSTAYKKLKSGDIKGSCKSILMWKYAGGLNCFDQKNANICGGIKKRRITEYNLCISE